MTELWLVCVAAATPIAGVVGFAIQIRTVRKVRLENSKLELEILRLQRELEAQDSRIVRATFQDIKKYGDTRFSRSGVNPGSDEASNWHRTDFLSAFGAYALMVAVMLFIGYLCFDVYRAAMLLWSAIAF